ncbi:hypothetical protein BD413DRAFT_24349 [Trametes elegans]|nr:hypothetical protein BD413DRAFT_24349 [Trametes elegans]
MPSGRGSSRLRDRDRTVGRNNERNWTHKSQYVSQSCSERPLAFRSQHALPRSHPSCETCDHLPPPPSLLTGKPPADVRRNERPHRATDYPHTCQELHITTSTDRNNEGCSQVKTGRAPRQWIGIQTRSSPLAPLLFRGREVGRALGDGGRYYEGGWGKPRAPPHGGADCGGGGVQRMAKG